MATQQVRITTNFDTNKDTRKQMDYNKTAIVPTALGSSLAFPFLMSKLSNAVRHRWEETCFPNEAHDDYSNYDLSNLNDAVKKALMIPKNSTGAFGRGKFYFFKTNSYYDSAWSEKRRNYNGTNTIGLEEWSIFNGGNSLGKTFDFIANNDDIYVAYVPVSEITSLPSSVTRELSSKFNASGTVYVKLNDISTSRRDYINNLLADGDYVRTSYSNYDGNFVTIFSGTDTARTEVFGLYPCYVVEHDGYYVAEVDVDGNYTNRLIEQQGTMYESFSPFSLIDYMTNSRRNRYLALPGFEIFKTFSDFFKEDDILFMMDDNNKTSVIIKKEVLIRYLNYVGIPWTFDKNAATNTSISNLSDGYDPKQKYYNPSNPPGQNDNTTGDWTGSGDNTENSLDFTSPNFSPTQNAVNQYALNSLQLQSVSNFLFTADIFNDWDLLKNDPREGLVSCKYFPFDIRLHDSEHVGNQEEIVIGGVQMDRVEGARILSGYNQILDLGEFDVEEYFGGFLDYQLTSIDVYLPYCGWQQLNTSAIMNRKLKIKYVVDIQTGDCACLILSTDGNVDRLENVFSGQMGIDIPLLTSNHNENVKQTGSTILSAGVAVGGAIATFATGGAAAPVALAGAGATIANSASSVATMMNHQKLGTPVSSSLSMWMPQDIIFRITRPRKSEASEFKNRRGYRSNYSTQLKNVRGFVQIDDPFLDGLSLHEGEKEQLAQILKGGIFI